MTDDAAVQQNVLDAWAEQDYESILNNLHGVEEVVLEAVAMMPERVQSFSVAGRRPDQLYLQARKSLERSVDALKSCYVLVEAMTVKEE